ncbi:TetR/AcrR family transcriptional regulator [Candidatus Frankia alpina]|uniref:TetR/AcrR family transcriptional regulator n=1 Tax=Candidatus Frankia alpina TaxID=2699483 RepID=UPI0013D46103|nr:TetR/AcrR family transcriptional regulator [Candidatus Frankia alpina]
MSQTRERILTIARDLFSRNGYSGTTNADIARELGTTTAALYYHFPSKAAILDGLVAEPLAAYRRIIECLNTGPPAPPELLGAFIDLAADSRELAALIDREPGVLAAIDKRLPRAFEGMIQQVIVALAGPDPDRAAILRAHAAFAAIKHATMAAIALNHGTLDPADRAEILLAALRILQPAAGD